jgi:cytochrome c biogenesis protein CcmG/thiol:disulfide interchange protein DsbE
MTDFPSLKLALTRVIARDQAAAAAPWHRPRIGRRIAIVSAAVFVATAGTVAATQVLSLDDAVQKGERPAAPDQSLPVLGSPGTGSLAQYRGKTVVLSFYASWCGPCRDQAAVVDQAGRTLATNGDGLSVLVGVQDSPDTAAQFAKDGGLSATTLEDQTGTLAAKYGVDRLPATFVIDPAGRVVAIQRTAVTSDFLSQAIAKASSPSDAPAAP